MHQVILSRLGDPRLKERLVRDLTAKPSSSWLVLLPTARLLHALRYELVQGVSPALNLLTFDELVDQAVAAKHRGRAFLGGQLREELFFHLFRGKKAILRLLGNRISRAFSRELLAVVTQLGRAGVKPEDLWDTGELGELVGDISLLYSEYLKLQDRLALADVEHKYRLGTRQLRELAWLGSVHELHIAWFFDFEAIQLDVIRELATFIPRITVHLPFGHQEPYTIVTKTLKVLEGLGFALRELPCEDEQLPEELSHLTRFLFVPGAKRITAPQVTSLAAPRVSQELALVAREIKALAAGGVLPGQIALVVPDKEHYGPELQRLFRQWQVDISLPWVSQLQEIPWVREILNLWLAASGDPKAMVRALKAAYISHFLPQDSNSHASQWLARSLGEPGDIAAWQEALENMVTWLKVRLEEQDLDYMTRESLKKRQALVGQGKVGLGALLEFLAVVGQTSVQEHCLVMEDIIRLNLERICSLAQEELARRDKLAAKVFSQALTSLKRSREIIPDEPLSPREFAELLGPWLMDTVALERLNPRAVQVLAPSECRGLTFPYVFILGLNQNLFPRAISRHWLWDRPGLKGLAEKLGQDSAHSRLAREKIFFHGCLAMAHAGLWLVRQIPGINEEAEASVFQLEVEALLAEHQTKALTPAEILPGPGQALDLESLAKRAVYQGVWGQAPDEGLPWLAGKEGYPLLYQCYLAEVERASPHTPGPWDGVVTGNAMATAYINKRFASKIWSISRLEAYIRCPFAFFARYVLQAEGEPGAPAQFDALERGTWGHWVMEKFWARHPWDSNLAQGEERLKILALEWVTLSGRDSSQRIWQERAKDLAQGLVKLVKNDLDWFAATGFKPRYSELEFGPKTNLGAVFPGKGEIGFRGKIDRVDIRETESGSQAVVFDYKTTRGTGLKDIKDGVSLQIPIYIAAVGQSSVLQAQVVGGSYLILKTGKREGGLWLKELATGVPGTSKSNSLSTLDYQEFEENLKEQLLRLHQEIARGVFSPGPAKASFCQWCEFKDCCRYDQFRFADKGRSVDDEYC